MLILAIETSCDETAAAVVEDGVKEITSVLASSEELHQKTGGIVPEVAARKQVEYIIPVISETIEKAQLALDLKSHHEAVSKIDAIAVTIGPGLIGSLIVGVEAAKALSFVWSKPLIPVNHLIGHIYGNFLDNTNADTIYKPVEQIKFPAVVLIVSGGHTDLILMHGHGKFEYLGGTLDDAAGEAFDKTARLLGLSKYLGGAVLSEKAAECNKNILAKTLPRPMIHENNFDFSFSGLKTAAKRLIERSLEKNIVSIAEISREFEEAVVDVLVTKTIRAAKKFDAKSILLAGGVAANTNLRNRLKFEAESLNIPVFVPPVRLCTDSAVYIASAAYFKHVDRSGVYQTAYQKLQMDFSKIKANPSLGVMDII